MRFVLNIIWFVLAGLWMAIGYTIAALICVLAAQRYGNALDYAGPNLAPNQVLVYPVKPTHIYIQAGAFANIDHQSSAADVRRIARQFSGLNR